MSHRCGGANGLFTVLIVAALIVVAQITVRRTESSEEASAIAALRAITSAQLAYRTVNGGYATRLKTLATPCPAEQHGFVSPDLLHDPTIKNGYQISVRAAPGTRSGAVDCNGVPTSNAYYASALPTPRARRPARAFAVDQTGIVWYDTRGVVPGVPFKESSTTRRLR